MLPKPPTFAIGANLAGRSQDQHVHFPTSVISFHIYNQFQIRFGYITSFRCGSIYQ